MEKKLAEILARLKKIDADQAQIEKEAKLTNDGEFTDAHRAAYKALGEMFDQLQAEKVTLESDMEAIAKRSNREDDLRPRLTERRSSPNSGALSVPQNRMSGMPVETQNSETGETQIRFKIPRNVRRSGSLENFKGMRDGYTAEERAYRFGQWCLYRIQQDLPGRYRFDDATAFVQNYVPQNTAHSETGATSNGQVLVPDEFSRDMIDLREMYGLARRLFGRAPMTSDVLHVPRRASGLTAYFVAENAAGTESNMSWNDVQLVAKDVMAISRMSRQLDADAVINVGDTLAGEMAYAFSEKEDQCAFNGDGGSTYAGIQGCRSLLTSIDGAGTDSAGLKIQGTSNTWATQVMADFHAVVGKLPIYADNNAVWVCHKAYFAEVMQKLEIASGGTTAREVSDGDRRPRPTFLGYPVEFSQVFPSVTATTGVMCLLGDFSKGALFGDRQQTEISFSEHASIGGENVFERNQIAIRGTERFDINVHGCGTASVAGPIVGLATA